MKILIVVDKKGSAIWRMAKDVEKNLSHFDIKIIDVHPKRPDPEQIDNYRIGVDWADVIDYQYWKSALMLLKEFPNNKPKILQHHNPYNLNENDWKEFNAVVVNNKTMQSTLKSASLIPNSIDTNFFQFQREMPDSNKVLMIAARIEGKKGILPVAEVCKELGYPMILVGSISDRDYFDRIMATGIVEFREQISEEDLLKTYYESAIHVCNSVDNFESGTNPILEAMATGVPVLTRKIGHVPDIYDETNMVVRKGDVEDLEDLKIELKKLMEDKELRMKIRENAWKSVKSRDSMRRAVMYEKLYWNVYKPNNTLISIIIPTFNRKDITLSKVIASVINQDWEAKEIIICDDGSSDGTKESVLKMINEHTFDVPIKYVNTNTPNEYNLAYAKNLGVIESVGEILVFIDDRYLADSKLLTEFASSLREKQWLYGNKGTKKDFIENVSCIYRQEFIDAGMFNQSCRYYGFQSQELRIRFQRQGFKLKFIESAKVETLMKTKNKYKKRNEIIQSKNILWKLGLEK
jgi:glycosyltransferase involved in cell wall biosynthesis